jgi:sirohydrochlorin cobaltochelatase
MSGRALVLAAHGSREPAVNEAISDLARRVGSRLCFDEAIAAFHEGDPPFSRALDGLRSEHVVVVPLLQSEGYYCHRVLPAALARNRRFPAVKVRQTRAVGVHPELGAVLARRVQELRDRRSLVSPAVALVGHGTPRYRGSRQAAEASARDLERRTSLESRAFFLDEAPAVEAILNYAPGRDLVVLPLLIGAGRHASLDLRRRLGLAEPLAEVAAGEAVGGIDACCEADEGELHEVAGGGRILLDRPLGLDPAIEHLVADLASGEASPLAPPPGPGQGSRTVNLPSGDR